MVLHRLPLVVRDHLSKTSKARIKAKNIYTDDGVCGDAGRVLSLDALG